MLQRELPLFVLSKNPREVKPSRKACTPRIYWTTRETIEILELSNPYFLRKAKDFNSAYRSDEYIAVSAGRNKWEIFQRYKA
jgi:hypothetical protein